MRPQVISYKSAAVPQVPTNQQHPPSYPALRSVQTTPPGWTLLLARFLDRVFWHFDITRNMTIGQCKQCRWCRNVIDDPYVNHICTKQLIGQCLDCNHKGILDPNYGNCMKCTSSHVADRKFAFDIYPRSRAASEREVIVIKH